MSEHDLDVLRLLAGALIILLVFGAGRGGSINDAMPKRRSVREILGLDKDKRQ